jgi:CRISPR system Cascade subunit CasE
MNGYFSRIRLRENNSLNPALVNRLTVGYGLHQSLWQLFSERGDETRDFLYRQVDGQGGPTFYVVSIRAPKLDDALWTVETKPYAPCLEAGAIFAFSLRANATRSTHDPETGKERRHDAILHARRRGVASPDPDGLQEAGRAWLAERAEKAGFSLVHLRVDGHQNHRLSLKGKGPIRFSTVDLEGVLKVVDPDSFKRTLFQGLGRSKGFGCGLLLIRHV